MDVASDRTAYVAVGSNIDAAANVRAALALLLETLQVVAVSTLYRTAPVRRPEQPSFVNGIWALRGAPDPRALKYDVLRPIEDRLGRVRTADAHAPRTIDLDLVLYGSQVIREPDLVLPDPEILRRPFLAVPLLELAPGLVIPGTSLRLADQPVCRRLDDLQIVADLTRQLREMIEP